LTSIKSVIFLRKI